MVNGEIDVGKLCLNGSPPIIGVSNYRNRSIIVDQNSRVDVPSTNPVVIDRNHEPIWRSAFFMIVKTMTE